MPRLLLTLLVLAPGLPRAGDPVGPETCKACHPAAYAAWSGSAHARALAGVPEARRAESRCTGCHAPDLARGIAGVTCEACHGGGRLYAHRYVMRDRELARAVGLVDPGPQTCSACHDVSAPSLGRFEYVKKLPLIDHWTADRAARAGALTPQSAPHPAR